MLKSRIKRNLLRSFALSLFCVSVFSHNINAYESQSISDNVLNANSLSGISLSYLNQNHELNLDKISPKSLGFYTKETVVGKQRKNWVFCGYAVPTWQKASSYQSGKTYSAGTSYTIYGMSTNISVSKYASATIPANPKKWSRLAAYADITFKKVKIEQFQGGHPKPIRTTYRIDKVYHNKYLSVRYK